MVARGRVVTANRVTSYKREGDGITIPILHNDSISVIRIHQVS